MNDAMLKGSVVGYGLCDSASDAANGMNRCLNGKGLRSESLRVARLLNERWAWSSRRPRPPPSKSPIILHHAFLEFRPRPSRGEIVSGRLGAEGISEGVETS